MFQWIWLGPQHLHDMRCLVQMPKIILKTLSDIAIDSNRLFVIYYVTLVRFHLSSSGERHSSPRVQRPKTVDNVHCKCRRIMSSIPRNFREDITPFPPKPVRWHAKYHPLMWRSLTPVTLVILKKRVDGMRTEGSISQCFAVSLDSSTWHSYTSLDWCRTTQ